MIFVTPKVIFYIKFYLSSFFYSHSGIFFSETTRHSGKESPDSISQTVRVGVQQVSALRPYLIALVINEITMNMKIEVPWRILFIDDVYSVLNKNVPAARPIFVRWHASCLVDQSSQQVFVPVLQTQSLNNR